MFRCFSDCALLVAGFGQPVSSVWYCRKCGTR